MPTTPPLSVDILSVSAPPDAIEVHDWSHVGDGLPTRVFAGTIREASGFTVRVAGLQRINSTCRRWITVETDSLPGTPLKPQRARQLAAALIAVADEIETRR